MSSVWSTGRVHLRSPQVVSIGAVLSFVGSIASVIVDIVPANQCNYILSSIRHVSFAQRSSLASVCLHLFYADLFSVSEHLFLLIVQRLVSSQSLVG